MYYMDIIAWVFTTEVMSGGDSFLSNFFVRLPSNRLELASTKLVLWER